MINLCCLSPGPTSGALYLLGQRPLLAGQDLPCDEVLSGHQLDKGVELQQTNRPISPVSKRDAPRRVAPVRGDFF
jgi:hypothetical protein